MDFQEQMRIQSSPNTLSLYPMPVSNKKLFLFFRGLLIVLILGIVVDFTLASLPGTIADLFAHHYLAAFCALSILVLFFIRINYFSYEDEYEIIHIRSKSLIFGNLSKNSLRYEFPKNLLYSFDYRSSILGKRLTIYLRSNSGVKKVRHFNLSFINNKDLQYVLQSMEKIVARNKAKLRN